MPKNIVIFSDGTGQDGGVRADQRLSNVYKMYRATRVGPDSSINPAEQVAFYDPGLGTDADVHGWGRVRHTLDKFLASVAGRGIGTNIADCYEFILNHWQPGDRIFIIGFSRGAYTARCVAQVLALCGVPVHEPNDPSTPFRRFARSTRKTAERAVHQVYEHGAGHARGEFEAEREELARRFRVEFGSDVNGIPNAHPHFIGVFDTVAALGAKGAKWYGLLALLAFAAAIPIFLVSLLLHGVAGLSLPATFTVLAGATALAVWLKMEREAVRFIEDFPEKGAPRRTHRVRWRAENYDRGLSGHVGYARQASAIDEDRADFPRVPWGRHTVIRQRVGDEPPPLVQLWFAGNHSDVGGSYPEVESRLSDVALEWMVEEATSIPDPLIVDRTKLAVWPDATGTQHSELIAVRDCLSWVPRWAPAWLKNGWTYEARKPSGSPVHPSVFERFAAPVVWSAAGTGPYRPACLAEDSRFRHYYDGVAPEIAGVLASLEAMSFRLPGPPVIDFSVLSGQEALAAVLAEHSAHEGAILMAPGAVLDERDDYRDQLALAYLDRLIARAGAYSLVIEGRRASDPLFYSTGRLVPGVGATGAVDMARKIGLPAVVTLSQDGRLSMTAVTLT